MSPTTTNISGVPLYHFIFGFAGTFVCQVIQQTTYIKNDQSLQRLAAIYWSFFCLACMQIKNSKGRADRYSVCLSTFRIICLNTTSSCHPVRGYSCKKIIEKPKIRVSSDDGLCPSNELEGLVTFIIRSHSHL